MRDKRTIALAFLALLLGAGLWMLFSPRERRDEGPRAAPREAVVSTDADVRAPLLAPVPVRELPRELAPLAAEAGRLPESPAASVAGESWLLELVLAESGAPAARADVWYGDAARGEELGVDEIDGHRRKAERLRADERGLVRLPLVPGRSHQVLAELDQHIGWKTFAREPGDVATERLELVRDWDLEVRVLQADGAPAAKIMVFLRAQSGGSSWVTSEDTGADGLARFGHAGLRVVERPGKAWSTGVDLPLSEALEHELDPSRAPEEPIVFRLPPLGEVEVLVLEADGRPVADETAVQLGLVLPGQPRDLSPFAHDARRYADETTLAGTALFRAVEPGFEIELRAGPNSWQSLARGFFPGPARARERVRRTLRVELDHPVLVFRAIDGLGQPLRETELELVQWSRSGWNTSRNERDVQTDAEGVFRVDHAAGWKEDDQHWILVSARDGAIGAALDLSRPFEIGLVTMGDLVLRAAPLLCEGRVVGADGAGVAGAEVVLETSLDGDDWETVDPSAKSDAEGAFSLHGLVFGERLRLSPRQEGKSGAAVECGLGQRGVELVLVATGAVAGAVLLDEGVPADQVHLRLVPEGAGEADEERDWSDQVEPGPSGEFRIDGQLPGRYALEVYLTDDFELVELPGVVVSAGETNRDARLAAIDLRRRLFVTRLRLLPPEPDPGLEGNLAYGTPGGETLWHYFRGNTAELVTTVESLDIECTIRGYRAVRLSDVRGELEVPLTHALRVRLVLPPSAVLPGPPRYLKATLVGGEHGGDVDWGASVFDESRESASLVGGTGRMRVQWMLERRSPNGASATTINVEPTQWFEVIDASQEQRFELQFSQQALDDALAKAPL